MRMLSTRPRVPKTLVITRVDRETAEWFDDLAAQLGGRAGALRHLREEDKRALNRHDDQWSD